MIPSYCCSALALIYNNPIDFTNINEKYYIITDISYSCTNITLVKYTKNVCEIIKNNYDSAICGREIDKLLYGYFRNSLQSKYLEDKKNNDLKLSIDKRFKLMNDIIELKHKFSISDDDVYLLLNRLLYQFKLIIINIHIHLQNHFILN